MTETTEPTTTIDDPRPDQLDMSLRADAGVHWTNPDSLTRDQLIRVNAVSLALQCVTFKLDGNVPALLAQAETIAAFIDTGERPATEQVGAITAGTP